MKKALPSYGLTVICLLLLNAKSRSTSLEILSGTLDNIKCCPIKDASHAAYQ